MAAQPNTSPRSKGGDYDVGYGRPPAQNRFKPGQSGNPRGRPRGAKNKPIAWDQAGFDALIREEANRPMTINDNGRSVTIPMVQAVVRRVGIDALQGRSRAQKLLLGDLVGGADRRRRALQDEHLKAMIEYKIEGMQKLAECKRKRVKSPEMVPHPEDIIVDISTNTAKVFGPMTPEMKAVWELLAKRRDDARRFVAEWGAELETATDKKKRRLLREAIVSVSEKLQEVIEQVGEWPHHRLSGSGTNLQKFSALWDRDDGSMPTPPQTPPRRRQTASGRARSTAARSKTASRSSARAPGPA